MASSDKDVERKTCQGEKDVQTNIWHQKELTRERVPRDDVANGCDKQAVRMRSYRLTLFLWASPPRNFRHPEVTGKLPIVTRNLGNPTINLRFVGWFLHVFYHPYVLLWIVCDIGFATLMGIVNQFITGGHHFVVSTVVDLEGKLGNHESL